MKNATAYALDAKQQLAEMGSEIVHFKSKLTTARDDAQRVVRKGWHAAEDFVDELTFTVKRQPMKSIGVTFGVALGVGALMGWLLKRK